MRAASDEQILTNLNARLYGMLWVLSKGLCGYNCLVV